MARVIVWFLGVILLYDNFVTRALSDPYPSRPINLLVPFTPGGSVDLIGRLLASEMSEQLGQPVIVMNVPGGSGAVATMRLVGSAPDGYNIELATPRELSTTKLMNPNIGFDVERDFTYVGLAGRSPLVVVGGPTLGGANTLDDVLATARERPGGLTYATSGFGSPQHFLGELIKLRTDTNLVHVPFSGGAGGVMDVLGGHVDLSIVTLSSAREYIRTGTLRAFAVADAKRSVFASEIPALAETRSFADVDMGIWYGLLAPAKTPATVVSALNRGFNESLKRDAVQQKLGKSMIAVLGGGSDEFEAYARRDAEWYRAIANAAHMTFAK
jgi:tripartite-type tricarboxylate transporter receptor subunit TctC